MKTERIAEIAARLAAITKGEWKAYLGQRKPVIATPRGSIASACGGRAPSTYRDGMTRQEAEANALFIAAAPEDIKYLLGLAQPEADGCSLIAAERKRQIEAEGWTPEHDDEHCMGEMVGAAITYAGHALEVVTDHEIEGADGNEFWPWDMKWWKPSPDPIRNLVKAGALIAAEIDRLQRAKVLTEGEVFHHAV